MRWRGRQGSDNILDHRNRSSSSAGGFRGARGAGLLPIVFQLLLRSKGGRKLLLVLAVVGVILYLLGINPLALLSGQPTGYQSSQLAPNQTNEQTADLADLNDPQAQFISVVLADTETIWQTLFTAQGLNYREPTLVLFRNAVQSACGYASAAVGPFYCAADERIYIDLSFYDELSRRFDAPGDFAQAYVVAHEVGHHIQNLTGVLPRFHQAKASLSERDSNAMSIRVELQADCYAGVWGYYTNQAGYLETGDLNEALNAARQIGDDAIQRRVQGYVVPESFNHGTSEQRRYWFQQGFESGNWQACDTFNTTM